MIEIEKSALPKGWRWATLKEICEINPRRSRDLDREDSESTTFVPMSAVDDVTGTISETITRPFSEVKKGYTYFEEGDVLFAKITPCMENGKHAIARNLIDGFGFGTTEFHVLRPGVSLSAEWLHFYLRRPEILRQAAKHLTGAVGQQRVPPGFLADLEIPLPLLSEQKRIAALLKEQLAAVERARKASEARLEAARALSAAYFRAAFDDEHTKTWSWIKLGDISNISGGIQKTPQRTPVKNFRPYLTVRNVQRGFLDLSSVEQFEVQPSELKKYQLQDEDLLIVEGNGSKDHIGRNAIFIDDGKEWVHQNHIIRVRLNKETCLPEFASAYLNSSEGKKQMLKKAETTSGLYTLSTSKISSLDMPIPPIELQEYIIKNFNIKKTQINAMISATEEQYKQIKAMPLVLLKIAFSGAI